MAELGGCAPGRVTVWVKSPAEQGLGIASGLEAKSGGAAVTVDVPHAFGQTAPSEDEAD